MRKKDKALIFLLIALILFIIICISIFSKITKTENDVENNDNYEDEKYVVEYEKHGKYEPSVINNEYLNLNNTEIKAVDNVIDKVVDIINKKEYLQLYQMVDNQYKEIFFENIEEFEKYMKENFASDNYKAFSYRIEDDACYVIISDESELQEDNYKELKIYNYTYPNDIIVYFEDIVQILGVRDIITTSEVLMKMDYIIEYSDKVKLIYEIMNIKDKNVEFVVKDIKLKSSSYDIENKALSTNKVNLKAEEVLQIGIECSKNKKMVILPTYIEYNIITNGVEQSYDSLITYDEDRYNW